MALRVYGTFEVSTNGSFTLGLRQAYAAPSTRKFRKIGVIGVTIAPNLASAFVHDDAILFLFSIHHAFFVIKLQHLLHYSNSVSGGKKCPQGELVAQVAKSDCILY